MGSRPNDSDHAIFLSETNYNSIGKPDTTEDENHIVTKYWYDETGNLVETEVYAVYDEQIAGQQCVAFDDTDAV